MTTDAIVLLKQDHKEVRRPFRDFEAAGEGAREVRADLVSRIVEARTIHTYIENEVMYPGSADAFPTWSRTSWSPTRSTTSPISCAPSPT